MVCTYCTIGRIQPDTIILKIEQVIPRGGIGLPPAFIVAHFLSSIPPLILRQLITSALDGQWRLVFRELR